MYYFFCSCYIIVIHHSFILWGFQSKFFVISINYKKYILMAHLLLILNCSFSVYSLNMQTEFFVYKKKRISQKKRVKILYPEIYGILFIYTETILVFFGTEIAYAPKRGFSVHPLGFSCQK